jgi:hypothetical protein
MAAKNEMIRKQQNYKVNNWRDYNLSLKKRGGLEIWISDEIEELWYEKDIINDGTGKPRKYTEKSIELGKYTKRAKIKIKEEYKPATQDQTKLLKIETQKEKD